MRASVRRGLIGLPLVGLLVLVVAVLPPCVATWGRHQEAVTALVRRCPRARTLVGEDADIARLGLACGQTREHTRRGRASWTVTYTGARGRGQVSYLARNRTGDWRVERAELVVDGEAIDLLACAAGAAATTR